MRVLERVHGDFVFGRRVRRLGSVLADLIPEQATVLDVGCGNGAIGREIMTLRPDVQLRGIELIVRGDTQIPVEAFDGETLPVDDGGVDVVLFVDVLHHSQRPSTLLYEAGRVARKCILIKDHLREGVLADATLRFMDWVGNARYGIPLPYAYWTRSEWNSRFQSEGLTVIHWQENLDIYPPPASWIFDRSLHFVGLLRPQTA